MGLMDKAGGAIAQVQSHARAAVEAQRAQAAEAAQQQAAYRQWLIAQGRLMEYKVETVRETLVGDKINHTELERLLNAYASMGWAVKSITRADVAGRAGPGGVSGLLVVFERPVTQ